MHCEAQRVLWGGWREKVFRCLWTALKYISPLLLQNLREMLDDQFGKAKDLNSETRRKYQEFGQALPADAAQKVRILFIKLNDGGVSGGPSRVQIMQTPLLLCWQSSCAFCHPRSFQLVGDSGAGKSRPKWSWRGFRGTVDAQDPVQYF